MLILSSWVQESKELDTKTSKEPDCFICQLVVVTIEMTILGDNVTMDHIVESLGYACDTLGYEDDGLVQACHDFVDEWLEIIIDMLVVNLMQPFMVCENLNICP